MENRNELVVVAEATLAATVARHEQAIRMLGRTATRKN